MTTFKPKWPATIAGRWRRPFREPAIEAASQFMQALYEAADLSDRRREELLLLHERLSPAEYNLRRERRAPADRGIKMHGGFAVDDAGHWTLAGIRKDMAALLRRAGLRAADFAREAADEDEI